jgi:hypothetical protein
LLSSAVVLGVSAIRPNAKPEISIAAPRTMANIRCDLVMSYPPHVKQIKMESRKKQGKQGATVEALCLVSISSAIIQHTRLSAGIARSLMLLHFAYIG